MDMGGALSFLKGDDGLLVRRKTFDTACVRDGTSGDGGFDCGNYGRVVGDDLGGEAGDDVAVAIDEELFEVPENAGLGVGRIAVVLLLEEAVEARSAYEKALLLAKTIEPEFQIRSIPNIERKLGPQK